MPNVPLMNFNKALNADPTSYFNAEVAFGEKSSEPARVQFKVRSWIAIIGLYRLVLYF